MCNEVSRGSAVILCPHVANGAPILLAVRNMPENEYDSGWQMLCNRHEETWEDARVCSVSEALELEPSLEGFIDLKPDVTVLRENVSSEWKNI